MAVLIIILFLVIIYGQSRYPLRKNLSLKRMMIANFRSVKVGERVIQSVLVALLSLALLSFIYFEVDGTLIFKDMVSPFNPLGFLMIIMGIIAFVQVFFLIGFLLSLLLTRESTNLIENVDLLEADPDSFIFSGYIIPICVAVFETIMFYRVLFYLLQKDLGLSALVSGIVVVLIYGVLKGIMRRSFTQAYSFFILGVSLSSVGLVLTLATGSLVIGGFYMFFCLLFIAFKNMKVNLRAK